MKEKNIKPALSFRIGINAGDVILQKKNLLGDGVNVAARLEQLSQPDGITISKSIFDYIEGKLDLKIQDLGIQQVKKNRYPWIPEKDSYFRREKTVFPSKNPGKKS